ncbi:uncharacterized protein LOC119662677 [Teleopsis dalmanni]|uniref:uncharacterized protein LOC119662677 n=1 Tax=Teleopsis dalmanni TaxID=139649 RepID=UPI0018CCD598|nr:uncharacterized protein LOC119662677 [Teleopsis dalmanni]
MKKFRQNIFVKMGRNIKDHYGDSEKQMLKGFKEELRRHRKRQNELVKNFKNEIREYKKKHPNNINKNFERALRRLQKEDAEKRRWKFSSLFKWGRGKNIENTSWDNSDSDQSEVDEDLCPITPGKKGRKRIASDVESNEYCKYCHFKLPKVNRKGPKIVDKRGVCDMTNSGNLSLCSTSIDESAYKQNLLSTPEFVTYLKELNAKQNKDSNIEEPGIFVVNMPPPLNCEVEEKVDGKRAVRKKHGKERIKYWKPKS